MTGPTQLAHRKTALTKANHPSSPSYHTIPANTQINRKTNSIYGTFANNSISMRHFNFSDVDDGHIINLLKTTNTNNKAGIIPDFYTAMDEVNSNSANLSKPNNLPTNFRKSHTCGSLFVKCNCDAKDQLNPLQNSTINKAFSQRQQHIQPLPLINFPEENSSIVTNRSQANKQHETQSPTRSENSVLMQNSFSYEYTSSRLQSTKTALFSQKAFKSNREKSFENALNTNDINVNSNGLGFTEDSAIRRSATHANAITQKQHSRISSPCLPIDLNLSDENQHLFQRRTRKSESALNKPERKLFGTFLHPDTNFIFTDANRRPSSESLNYTNSENHHPSTPANGHNATLDPTLEIPLNIIAQYSPDICEQLPRQRQRAHSTQKRQLCPLFSQTQDIESNGSTSESEKSIERSVSISNLNTTHCTTAPNLINAKEYQSQKTGTAEATIWRNARKLQKDNKLFQQTTSLASMNEPSINLETSNQTQQTPHSPDTNTTSVDVLHPLAYSALHIQIQTPVDAMQPAMATECGFSPNVTTQSMLAIDDKDAQIKSLQGEIVSLKDVIKFRDVEIAKLRREIHKLKSVLQQTTQHLTLDSDELLQPNSPTTPSTPTYTHKAMLEIFQDVLCDKCLKQLDNSKAVQMLLLPTATSKNAIVVNRDSSIDSLINANNRVNEVAEHQLSVDKNDPTGHQLLLKKQGVSGESCETTKQDNVRISIPKYEKDFASKQLIKEAIMDNDFLKNIDASQVRELVDSMYSLSISKGKFVIREGEAGAHLYVSAKGEFEVERNGKILGVMGPGKAFGELAILYNCTRTASIRVLCDANVWVLDRRVFQQIMMRTGLQRIENSVNFLKSVPLLKNLNEEVLAKIADVLEVEFYPANTYIIRQGASGDTFFIISQGSVRVTQKFAYSNEEQPIRILGQGDYFGEKALINEDKRTANIIALEPGVECLTLNRESFTHLIGDLSELKEKSYGDENRILANTYVDKNFKNTSISIQQEFANLKFSDMEIVTTLGIGGFGRVELVKVQQNNTVKIYALKCLCKQHIVDTKQEEHVFSERTIMLACNSPFICRLYRTFRDDKYVYMLLEACMGGEIWTMLRDQGCFNETSTKFIVACVLQAFEYLHERGIIYRDLKPENLMLNENGYVKLVDFGFAKCVGKSSKTWTFCGTPEYVAPEIILNKGHDRAVDYWAIGILIYELLSGKPPFAANDPMKIYNIILKGIDMIDFPKQMSRSGIQLVKKLCRDVPVERLGYQRGGISDIKKHKWFLGFDWDGLKTQSLAAPFQRPITHSTDTCYFDKFSYDSNEPPAECSGWDIDF